MAGRVKVHLRMKFGYDNHPTFVALPPVDGKILSVDDKQEKAFQFHLGCPIWNEPKWVPELYPKGSKSNEFLTRYANVFDTVELNSSHYALPSEGQVHQWLQKCRDGFLFCPKVPQTISHHGLHEHNKFSEIQVTEQVFRSFGSFLGMAFVQFPESASPSLWPKMKSILSAFSSDFPLAVEFRHPGFFHHGRLQDSIFEELLQMKKHMVSTITVGKAGVIHFHVTSHCLFLRFLGTENMDQDSMRISAVMERLRELKELGLRQVFWIAHQPNNALALGLARQTSNLAVQYGLLSHPLTFPESNHQGQLALF